MFRLTNRLALSNLIKNRKLYYPFALATILAIAITYIFTSLTLNPHLDDLTGADAIKMVLGMGLGIVALSSGIIVLFHKSPERGDWCRSSHYVTLSPFRSEGAKQINHPLCGCASKVIPS